MHLQSSLESEHRGQEEPAEFNLNHLIMTESAGTTPRLLANNDVAYSKLQAAVLECDSTISELKDHIDTLERAVENKDAEIASLRAEPGGQPAQGVMMAADSRQRLMLPDGSPAPNQEQVSQLTKEHEEAKKMKDESFEELKAELAHAEAQFWHDDNLLGRMDSTVKSSARTHSKMWAKRGGASVSQVGHLERLRSSNISITCTPDAVFMGSAGSKNYEHSATVIVEATSEASYDDEEDEGHGLMSLQEK